MLLRTCLWRAVMVLVLVVMQVGSQSGAEMDQKSVDQKDAAEDISNHQSPPSLNEASESQSVAVSQDATATEVSEVKAEAKRISEKSAETAAETEAEQIEVDSVPLASSSQSTTEFPASDSTASQAMLLAPSSKKADSRSRFAYVTLIVPPLSLLPSNPSSADRSEDGLASGLGSGYMYGARVLGRSLRESGTKNDLLALVPARRLTSTQRRLLTSGFLPHQDPALLLCALSSNLCS